MTGVNGDVELAATVSRLLRGRRRAVAAASVTPDEVRVAGIGAARGADFEIGSISKGVTGLLYVDALARGEVAPTSTLGDLLPLLGTPAAGLELGSITVHRSGLPGLPALPGSASAIRRTLSLWVHGANPYGENLDELLSQARLAKPGATRSRYSNFGFELLGHALASAAGTTFAELVQRRIAGPLGLTTFYVPAAPEGLRPAALVGRNRFGRTREPWTGEAIGPAGGIRAGIEDMACLVQALLNGAAPGAAALDPIDVFGGRRVRIGAAWITIEVRGRSITWHNGGTGGFRSWLGLDRDAGTGAVILSATSASVDAAGFRLLAELTEEAHARR
ncbi:serine hydrolase domain-containing protein [Phytoactinopolyspora mesophila]|uniref:Beta-lactamase n=1 Tax=Phytoactinopolyspora mesophila TaxID=2650750 RepID=A0A7K3M632_9ACTN|nr:serine hydrolase domain-containing protein [Phytoactinopolyspora mesophila]NDL58680.1 serine hydrolase [Phytoactinopolyspora mesophila]